jgi:hypothetical protein
VLLGLLAVVSGGPLGDGRLAAVGPSPWQVCLVSALELGIAAAVTAGAVNFLALRRAGALTEPAQPVRAAALAPDSTGPDDIGPDEAGHVIYLDRWAGEEPQDQEPAPPGPSAVPWQRDPAPDTPSGG